MKNFILIAFLLLSTHVHAQYTDYWTGKLNVGVEIIVDFNVTYGNDYNPKDISLDIPSQYVWELKCELLKWSLDSFNVDIAGGYARFLGKKEKHDSIATGYWIQNGIPISLILNRSLTGINPVRPQNPPLEHDYIEERLVIMNAKDKVNLYGTLTIPRDYKMKGCAILISGSGPQDMDESIMGHKPFWIIADHLTRNGFAVLRYDDRGSYRSTGDYSTATINDFASDVNAAIDMAKERTGLTDDKIGLIGHSEGSMVAQIVLAKRNLGFYISLAGPAAPVQQMMYKQNQDLGSTLNISEDEFNKRVGPFLKKVFAIAGDLSTDSTEAGQKIWKLYKKEEKKFSSAAKSRFSMDKPENISAWLGKPMRTFLSYVPEKNLTLLKNPFLAINGTADKQVNAKINLDVFRKYLGNNSLNEVKEIENKNHLFQTTTKGDIGEYGKLEETFSPDVLKVMVEWLNKIYP